MSATTTTTIWLRILVLGLAFLVGRTTAQGFWTNCTNWALGWEDGTVYRRFMVAECLDDSGTELRASFLPLNDCLTNEEGRMIPKKNGGIADSCSGCKAKGSVLECTCGRSSGGPILTAFDMNRIVKNVDGILGCHDYLGVEIDSIDASPA